MKFKKITLLFISILCIGGISVLVGNSSESPKDFKLKALNKTKIKTRPMTKEEKIHFAKVDKRISNAHKDMKKIIDKNIKDYESLTLHDIVVLSQGKFTPIKDTKFSKKILELIEEDLSPKKEGAIEPIVLVKKDKTEVIVAHKYEDGTNTYIINKYIGDEWTRTTQTIQGTEIPSLDQVDVNEEDIEKLKDSEIQYGEE